MSADLVAHPRAGSNSLAERVKQHRQQVGTFLLLDCSYSMMQTIAPHERAIDKLRTIARQLRQDLPHVRQVIFPTPSGADAEEIVNDIPEPCGQTPLGEAIAYSAARGAVRLVIVSDGYPTNPASALEAAAKATCQIDVCYIGEPGSDGERFLRALASHYGGHCDTLDLSTKQLESKIRGFLTA